MDPSEAKPTSRRERTPEASAPTAFSDTMDYSPNPQCTPPRRRASRAWRMSPATPPSPSPSGPRRTRSLSTAAMLLSSPTSPPFPHHNFDNVGDRHEPLNTSPSPKRRAMLAYPSPPPSRPIRKSTRLLKTTSSSSMQLSPVTPSSSGNPTLSHHVTRTPSPNRPHTTTRKRKLRCDNDAEEDEEERGKTRLSTPTPSSSLTRVEENQRDCNPLVTPPQQVVVTSSNPPPAPRKRLRKSSSISSNLAGFQQGEDGPGRLLWPEAHVK